MDDKIYIAQDLSPVHEVPSMVSSETMLGLFFIDGSNFYHNLKASGINPNLIDIVKVMRRLAMRLQIEQYRILYFNSIPSIIDGEKIYSEIRLRPCFSFCF